MPDIRQSFLYAQFITKINWQVEDIDSINVFIKKLPLLSPVIKIQRPDKLPESNKLKLLMQKYHAHLISVEPDVIASPVYPERSRRMAISDLKLLKYPYLPTKTIYINLIPTPEKIFNSFSEAKRRGCRKAQKNSVQVVRSENIDEFIKLKNKSAGFLGFLTTQTLKPLWKTFFPKNAFCLLAIKNESNYSSSPDGHRDEKLSRNSSHPRCTSGDSNNNIIAGVLILIWQKTAYYWMAAATETGKQNFAPTLLVWQALKTAKAMGCTNFDFEGIYDERYLKLNKEWLGFTKFKQGFGGSEIYFPKPFVIK